MIIIMDGVSDSFGKGHHQPRAIHPSYLEIIDSLIITRHPHERLRLVQNHNRSHEASRSMRTRVQNGQAERVKIDLRNFPDFYRPTEVLRTLDAHVPVRPVCVRRGANAGQSWS
jgi:hypothetical protein